VSIEVSEATESGCPLATGVDRPREPYVFRATHMTIDLTCQKCEGTFELDAQDLIEGTEKLVCPHCGQKAAPNSQEDFVSALTEMRTQVAALAKRFAVSMSVETEDLEDDIGEDEKDEEDEESDDEELDFDEDEDVEDEEDYDEDEDER
jgi:DNA-directed RNA polymerase subunit RPC12/RpoP